MDQMIAIKPGTDAPLPYVFVDRERIDLTVEKSARLNLSFAPSVWDSELFLVIDLYAAANQVHPEGHVGWWKLPLEVKRDVQVDITKGPDGFTITFNDEAPEESWKNPDFLGIDEPVIALHVVLRPVLSEAVRFDDILHFYNSPKALEASDALRRRLDHPSGEAPSAPWYVWPRQTTVHLVSTNVFERDAVGNFTFSVYKLLRSNDVPCQLYANNFDVVLRGTIRPTCEAFTAIKPDDLLIVNFSIFEPWLTRLIELPCKKIMYFHNITPPRFMQVYDAEYADHCSDGIAQLKHLDEFDIMMANSKSSGRVLQEAVAKLHPMPKAPDPDAPPAHGPFEEASRLLSNAVQVLDAQQHKMPEVIVSPPIIGTQGWEKVKAETVKLPPERTLLLYVGRVAPHKRIEDLFALFAKYRALNPDSALLVVGGARFDGYGGFLRYLLENEFAPLKEYIHFYENLAEGQLRTIYERASAYVTMSEHEGFCVPIIEAMEFGKPIFAFADAAVLETLDGSGRVFYSKDFDAIAADLATVLSTPWLERRIVAEQRKRLEKIVEASSGYQLWAALEKVMYGARPV